MLRGFTKIARVLTTLNYNLRGIDQFSELLLSFVSGNSVRLRGRADALDAKTPN
jgi:hypothetical protein